MKLKTIFVGEGPEIRPREIKLVFRESLPGLALVAGLGFLSYLLTHLPQFGFSDVSWMRFIDTLVLAVVLGMVARLGVTKTRGLTNRLLPGILLAPMLFIPLGIALYGMSFRLDQMSKLDGSVIMTALLAMLISMLAIYFLAVRVFKLSKKLAYLLGVGSAICGASAIAITSPAINADPDEMGAALVTNTLLALLSLLILKWIASWMAPQFWAMTAGALLPQTGFVKLAVVGELQDYALLVKTLRVSMLLVLVPLTYYFVQGKLFIPWYLILFAVVGLWYSFAAPGKELTAILKTTYDLLFSTALAGIGLNANLGAVMRKIWMPLLITTSVFCVGAALYLSLR